jgi:hypothetical protein
MLSQDSGAIVSQYYSTSYLSTAPEQAPLFCLDLSRDLMQPSPLWLSVAPPVQAPALIEHGAVVYREDHISDVLTQAPIFSQDPAGAASQIGWADPFGSEPATSYPIRTMRVREPAPIFSQDPGIVPTEQNSISYITATSVHDHINRSAYLPSFEILSQPGWNS